MKRRTIDGIKKLIEVRVRDIDDFTLSWFGGEPLLAEGVVREIGGFAHALCESSGTQFHGALTTNAYTLQRRLFEDLVAIRHNNYQITLDGDAEWHDRTRLLANKSGTFDVIWNNIVQMQGLQQDFRITLPFMCIRRTSNLSAGLTSICNRHSALMIATRCSSTVCQTSVVKRAFRRQSWGFPDISRCWPT